MVVGVMLMVKNGHSNDGVVMVMVMNGYGSRGSDNGVCNKWLL